MQNTKKEEKKWNGDNAKLSACRFNLLIHHSPFLHGSIFEMLCIRDRGKSSRCLKIFPRNFGEVIKKGRDLMKDSTYHWIFYLFSHNSFCPGRIKMKEKRIKNELQNGRNRAVKERHWLRENKGPFIQLNARIDVVDDRHLGAAGNQSFRDKRRLSPLNGVLLFTFCQFGILYFLTPQ